MTHVAEKITHTLLHSDSKSPYRPVCCIAALLGTYSQEDSVYFDSCPINVSQQGCTQLGLNLHASIYVFERQSLG